MSEHHSCYNFSLGLPAGEAQDNVSILLKHLAKSLDNMAEKIEIQDIVFSNKETDENGLGWPHFTIYYHLADEK